MTKLRAGETLDALILGASDAMRRLREEIREIASFPVRSLLVVGETGAGKELVPRGISMVAGLRRLEIFNCPAVPDDHLESELFGTTRSAYPGAVDRAGAAERAAGGILFLDEIAAMPLPHQAKVLRLLENREARRLGGTQPYAMSAMVVAATNEDLGERVESGRFRADLYHRIVQDGVIRVAPLRERREDIASLARVFVDELPACAGLDPDARRRLGELDWPGNVRQLRSVVRCAARLARRRAIGVREIDEACHRIALTQPRAVAKNGRPAEAWPASGFNASADHVRRRLLVDALARAEGNLTRAGLLLGMHRRRADPPEMVPDLHSVDLRDRKLAHRKFRYWWIRLVGVEGGAEDIAHPLPAP